MENAPVVRQLATLIPADLERLIVGYTSHVRYAVTKIESETRVALQLELVTLPAPFQKRFGPLSDSDVERYIRLAPNDFSFGVYDDEMLVGLALAERHDWNNSLCVWEFHVAESHQRRGLGRLLMQAVIASAQAAGLRIIVCETQNTNVPAINFYRSVGFTIEGIDLSYYSNEDLAANGEVAVFMKRYLS